MTHYLETGQVHQEAEYDDAFLTSRMTDLSIPEKHAVVRKLALDGLSSSMIAIAMGTTRNVVIGLAHRATPKIHLSPVVRKTRPVRPKAAKVGHSPKLPAKAASEPLAKPVYTDLTWEPLGGLTPIALVDLPNSGRCRWPVTGGFCGGACLEIYCETHRKMAYLGV